MSIKRKILTLFALLAFMPVIGGMPAWETVKTATPAVETESDPVEAEVRDGYIYVTATKAMNVKVFSIVGQLITQQNLQPGTWRLKMTKRGIYILRAGDRTIRVTI